MRLAGSLLSGVLILSVLTAAVHADGGIRISPDNPRYWELDGQPVLLIGGSRQDSLFQIWDLEEHLDLLVESGGNYVRNTMSHRAPGAIWPYRKEFTSAPGNHVDDEPWTNRFTDRVETLLPGSTGVYPRYDLTEQRREYWQRLEALLRLARERDIVVQIEIWDRFDFARDPWLLNPYNPANNVNYSAEQSGLEEDYPEHPNKNDNPFFRSLPELDDNRLLLGLQQAYVDRLLFISLNYDNVLYTVSNETSGDPAWSEYWARYVKNRAAERGVHVNVTEMWDPWDITAPMHDNTFAHPELYDFADVSQNNHQLGQAHWDKLNVRWTRIADRPRPLNNVKIYGGSDDTFGSEDDAIDRFWRNLLGGAASVRFHRPDLGIGLDEAAQKHIRSARMITDELDWMTMEPALDLLDDREPDEAYLFAQPGRQYLLYFTDGGRVSLRTHAGTERLAGRWLRPDRAELGDIVEYKVEGGVDIEAPGGGRWLLILRNSPPRPGP